MKNRDEFLIAIGNKKIVLGDTDKNALKEKQGTNWKKFLTFSFGGNKDNKEPVEEKVPQEKEKNQYKANPETDGREYPEELYHGRMLPPHSG